MLVGARYFENCRRDLSGRTNFGGADNVLVSFKMRPGDQVFVALKNNRGIDLVPRPSGDQKTFGIENAPVVCHSRAVDIIVLAVAQILPDQQRLAAAYSNDRFLLRIGSADGRERFRTRRARRRHPAQNLIGAAIAGVARTALPCDEITSTPVIL